MQMEIAAYIVDTTEQGLDPAGLEILNFRMGSLVTFTS